jgi:hypothetical protein
MPNLELSYANYNALRKDAFKNDMALHALMNIC